MMADALPAVAGKLTPQAPLAPLVWFKSGGPAEYLFEPRDAADLQGFLRDLDLAVPVMALGLGSNMIVRDGGVPGIVIRLGKPFATVKPVDAVTLDCGGGASGILVSSTARDAGIAGLEFLRSIPGTVGGFVRMNGGAYGGEVKDILVDCDVVLRSGERVTLPVADLHYTYRHSQLPEQAIVVAARFRGQPGEPDASFLRPADEQLAGGYIIYGPQTYIVVTFGQGVQSYIFDPDTNVWTLVETAHKVPPQASEFAINASNYRHWSPAIRAYIDDMLAGETGPHDRNFNMRWVASLVAETHRIMSRGGVFLYPGDERKGYERGRLRMVYECAPIAFVMEQAGGRATDGHDRILSQQARELHARTPFVFGSSEKVARVAAYQDLPTEEVNALFGKRGLFRA